MDELLRRFEEWPKTAHFLVSRRRQSSHAAITPQMIMWMLENRDDIDDIYVLSGTQHDGRIRYKGYFPPLNLWVRVIQLPDGSLFTAFRDDLAMRIWEATRQESWL